MSLSERWARELEQLRSLGRFRELKSPSGIDFSSNDYLGYAAPLYQGNAAVAKLARSGRASRLLSGQHPIWAEVETALAEWQHREAALVFTSGYAANEGLLSTVIAPQDWVASDELNHASIIDGLRLSKAEKFIYRHLNLNHLEEGLKLAARKRTSGRELFIVTESLFGMDGDIARLEQLMPLAAAHEAHLIVDEAHATGCEGPEGRGLVAACLPPLKEDRTLATVHTGGKALGVPGAFVSGSATLKALLVNRCRHLIFTTALPPLVGAWWLEAIERVRHDQQSRERLRRNSGSFRSWLLEQDIPFLGQSYIVPLLLRQDALAVSVAAQLQQRGLDVRAIRPPTVPRETARLRISIHADHSPEQLRSLQEALREVLPGRGGP